MVHPWLIVDTCDVERVKHDLSVSVQCGGDKEGYQRTVKVIEVEVGVGPFTLRHVTDGWVVVGTDARGSVGNTRVIAPVEPPSKHLDAENAKDDKEHEHHHRYVDHGADAQGDRF